MITKKTMKFLFLSSNLGLKERNKSRKNYKKKEQLDHTLKNPNTDATKKNQGIQVKRRGNKKNIHLKSRKS